MAPDRILSDEGLLCSLEPGTRIPCWECRLTSSEHCCSRAGEWEVGLGHWQVKVPQSLPTILKLPFDLPFASSLLTSDYFLEFWQKLPDNFFVLVFRCGICSLSYFFCHFTAILLLYFLFSTTKKVEAPYMASIVFWLDNAAVEQIFSKNWIYLCWIWKGKKCSKSYNYLTDSIFIVMLLFRD